MKKKFEILKVGNFYFPYIDRKKNFDVEDTLEIDINKKDSETINFSLRSNNTVHFNSIAEAIWKSIKKELNFKDYENCWFVPQYLYKIGNNYRCSVDVLREVK